MASESHISVLLCPSDFKPSLKGCYNNYCLSTGPNVGWTLDPAEAVGMSHPRVSRSLANVTDGASNTIFAAEIMKGTGPDGGDFVIENIIRGIPLPAGYRRIKPTAKDLANYDSACRTSFGFANNTA